MDLRKWMFSAYLLVTAHQAQTTEMDKPIDLPARDAPSRALKKYLDSLSQGSRRTTKIALNRVARFAGESRSAEDVAWESLENEHLLEVRTKLKEKCASPATANASIAAIKGLLKHAWEQGLMTADAYLEAIKGFRSLRLTQRPSNRQLTLREIRALVRNCTNDDTSTGRRDAALIALLAGAGLRRSEAAGVSKGDYDPDEESIQVSGPAGKERKAYLMRGAARLVNAWLHERGPESGPLLLKVDPTGEIVRPASGISEQTVMKRVVVRGERANVPGARPKDLTRAYAESLLAAGADIPSVQTAAGHATMTTTARHDPATRSDIRKTARLARLPR